MKKILCLGLILTVALLILPLKLVDRPDKSPAVETLSPNISSPKLEQEEEIRLLDTTTNTVKAMSAEEYVFGVVAAEMSALYESEALKAQAVAAYTFALFRKTENTDKDYDITNDFTVDQSFISKENLKEKWGSKAEEYEKKIETAVKAVENEIVTYENKPILAVYHAISSGKTESAENVWGKEYPYLLAVDSIGDTMSDDCKSTVNVTLEQLKKAVSSISELTGEPSGYFSSPERTESGTVKSISICGKSLTGSEVRKLFSLRSSNFKVEFKDEQFIFTVYGYGHNVGMSQFGADYLAKQGKTYKEILKHYYSGCEVKKQ